MCVGLSYTCSSREIMNRSVDCQEHTSHSAKNTATCDGQWHINKGKIVGTESKLYDGAQIITETCKNDWKIGECLTLRFMGIAAIP
jgi:hypothetical protein